MYKNNDIDTVNIDSLPISYDEKTDTMTFNFKSEKQAVIDRMASEFKEKNKLDLGLDERDTFYKLAEKYGLISNYANGKFENKYNISTAIMHKAVAVRLAIKGIAYKQYQVVYIANNVKKQTAFEIQQKSYELEGISTEVAPLRYYPYGEIGSSFVGYVGKISSNTEEYERMGYDVSRELIGKDRLEKVLENNRELGIQLRGEPGVKYVKVDKFGKVIRETSWRDPIPGDTVVTTIDMKLQEVAEKSFNQMMQDIRDGKYSSRERYPNANRGALVVMDVNTGEILALSHKASL
jgi:penicillin-binding protein 2